MDIAASAPTGPEYVGIYASEQGLGYHPRLVVTYATPPVGGEAYPVSKVSLLAPWVAGGIVLAGSLAWYVL